VAVRRGGRDEGADRPAGVVVGALAGGLIASAWGMRMPWLVVGVIQVGVAAVAARALTIGRD